MPQMEVRHEVRDPDPLQPRPVGPPDVTPTPRRARRLPKRRRSAWTPSSTRCSRRSRRLGRAASWARPSADPTSSRIYGWSPDGHVATDGPYAEAKEQLAGFFIIDTETRERAEEIAAQFAGPGSIVELRPAMWAGGDDRVTDAGLERSGATRRRTCSRRWCVGTATSTPPRTPSRRHSSPRPRQWPEEGLPGRPEAWLIRVASRRLVDQWRASRHGPAARSVVAALRRTICRAGRRPRPTIATTRSHCCSVLPPVAEPALAGGPDAASGRRSEHGADRARVPRPGGHHGPTDQPREGPAAGDGRPVRRTLRARSCRTESPPCSRSSTSCSPRDTRPRSGGDLIEVSLADEAIRLTRELHRLLPASTRSPVCSH